MTKKQPPRPPKPTFRPENIPEEIKEIPHWCLWKYTFRNGKWTKPPYKPNGRNAKSTDKSTLVEFKIAIGAYETGGFDGIGFALFDDDQYVGFDFDHSLDENGKINDNVYDQIALLDTYAEISPSGHGLRAIARGKLPEKGRKSTKLQWECYESGRYLTFTGDKISISCDRIRDRDVQILEVHGVMFPPKPEPPRMTFEPVGLDAEELFERMTRASNYSKIQDLMDGIGSDKSAGDLSLCNYFAFWTGCDPALMDEMFRATARIRPKWDTVHYGDGRTYGQATIQKAISGCTAAYGQKKEQEPDISGLMPKPSTPITDLKFYTVPDMWDCDLDKIPYDVERWIPRDEPWGLAGDGGCGKTWVMLEMANAITHKSKLFGRFGINRNGPVVIFDKESGYQRMAIRTKLMGINHPGIIWITEEMLGNVYFDDKNFPDIVQTMLDRLPERPIATIWDSWVRFFKGNENNAQDVAKAFGNIRRMCRESGVSAGLNHHTNKGQSNDRRPDKDRIRGSGDWTNALSAAFFIKQTKNGKVISEAKCRDYEEMRPKQILLDFGLHGTKNLYFKTHDAPPPSQPKKDQAKTFILSLLSTELFMTKAEIIAEAGARNLAGSTAVSKALNELMAEDQIISSPGGGRGNPTVYSITGYDEKMES